MRDPETVPEPESEHATPPAEMPAADDTTSRDGEELVAGIERLLGEIEVALTRLDEGSYGRCETCGVPIPASLIGADPLVRRCTEHQGQPPARPS